MPSLVLQTTVWHQTWPQNHQSSPLILAQEKQTHAPFAEVAEIVVPRRMEFHCVFLLKEKQKLAIHPTKRRVHINVYYKKSNF